MVDREAVKAVLREQQIELPSWAFGNSGTRFKVFAQRGIPRDPFEKIADAARVHAHTGVAPSVALHIPWDAVSDYSVLGKAAADAGIRLGTINANVFQDDDYKLGSVTNPDAGIRRKALDHLLACVDVMDQTGSQDLKLWFSDGINYPGQDSIRGRQDRLAEALAAVYERLTGDQRLILEYKLFEPAFYATDVPDWGTAFAHCLQLGEQAKVCVDTGHHALATNIEFIVAFLLRAGKLGAFDFNSRFYADDDLMAGAADPFQLFRILFEVVAAGGLDRSTGIAFMLDECHNIEAKIPGQIRSVMNVQEATAKALLVDTAALAAAQEAGDVLGANGVLMDAYNTDVRPLLAELRGEQGIDPDPMASYAHSGYGERIVADRVGGNQAGWEPELPCSQRRTSRTHATDQTESDPVNIADTSESTVNALVGRSNRLGADPRNTNFAGGNTSAKGTGIDPVTSQPVELCWVKGSGGDLGTLRPAGLAVLRLDRLRALAGVYPGVEREDEMVAAFDYCLHGKGGAAPSIDTAMHGLLDAPHVDHLHPDSGIALATAADGEALTAECFGDRVVWVPWRRPGFQLGLDIAAIARAHPDAIGCILGGHGITSWGSTSEQCEARSLEIIRTAEAFLADRGKPEPFGPVLDGFTALAPEQRRARAAALAPTIRGLASTDTPQVGHFTDSEPVLDFLSRAEHPRLAALGTSCPDHFLRTKVRPMVLDLPPTAPLAEAISRLRELHEAYRTDYAAYYDRHATPQSPAMRGADPAIVLVPGIGMFSFGKAKQTARVAGEFYVNAINVMRGAESVSTYSPIEESEKFRIEYWLLEEAKLQRLPKPKALATRVALVTGAASGIGRAIAERLAAEGACVVVADLDLARASEVAAGIGNADVAVGVAADVSDEAAVARAFTEAVLAFGGVDLVVNNAGLSISKPLLETTVADWDLQHDVMAKGSFLVSRAAARVLGEQAMGGDIVYISSKNSLFAGPNNIAYGSTKADQAHQVRLLAAELGGQGIRVNGINPDGVVRGSGIFAGGWGASRAKVYGVAESDLGAFYAQRTLLKREVLPEHVANAVFVLTGGELSHTTGMHIPVDAGVAAAFLR